jgi:BirA family biotin operon repressor/biotin-[acetyl-CoA-carboxylase] ligase
MSLLLRSPPALLPLIAAVAVCDVAGEEARIKWPNDIVVPRAGALPKLAGILIEGRPQEQWAVLGIGLNVALSPEDLPPEVAPTAATLGAGREEIEPTLDRLLRALERRLAETPQETLEAWRLRDGLYDREIGWRAQAGQGDEQRGRAQGIDGAGRLIVALDGGGRLALEAGEVHLVSR